MQFDQIKRREFITLLGGAATWPLAGRAQQPKVWRIGVLAPLPPTPVMLSAFRDGMRGRGYVEGQNLSIDVRWPQGTFEHDPSPVAELINSNVDVIVAWATPATIAARRATSTVPIVMVGVGDPVGSGFIASLARPGGNITGLSNITVDLSAKADGTVCRTGSRHEARRRGSQPQQSGRDRDASGDRGGYS